MRKSVVKVSSAIQVLGAVVTLALLTSVNALAVERSTASLPQHIDAAVIAPLRNAKPGTHIILNGFRFGDSESRSIELEPFEVWAPNGELVLEEGDGRTRHIVPAARQFFKGSVVGRDDSAVYMSLRRDGRVRGLVMIGGRRFNVARQTRADIRSKSPRSDDAPLSVTEIDEAGGDGAAPWTCSTDTDGPLAARVRRPSLAAAQSGKLIPNGGGIPGATYSLTLAIHVDFEMYAALGVDVNAVDAYVADLVGAASVIYQRDVNTQLQVGVVPIATSPGVDPVKSYPPADPATALAEFGTYFHNFPDVVRSAAILLTGKPFTGGIAWQDTMCQPDFYCGADGSACGSSEFANSYGGAYAVIASTDTISSVVPDPNGSLPTDASFWMLLEFCHEVGHLCNGPHTNCVPLTAQDQANYGVTRPYVDLCQGNEPGCYSGPASAPPELGTIMSFCHNFFGAGGVRESRYMLGRSGEPSEKIPPYLLQAIDQATPNAAITAPTNPACNVSTTASVASCSGCSYSWTIDATQASGISGQYTNVLTFTPTVPTLTLSVTVTTANGCGMSTTTAVTTQCTTLTPPASVNATAVHSGNCPSIVAVQVTWPAVNFATGYDITRTSDGLVVGSTTSTSWIDCSVAGNTAYLYRVRATRGTSTSAFSAPDLATTILFTDDPIVAPPYGTTAVKAVHVAELATAIDAVATLAGTASVESTSSSGCPATAAPGRYAPIAACFFNNMRAALNNARSRLGLSTVTFRDDPLLSHTAVKGIHIDDLRSGVK